MRMSRSEKGRLHTGCYKTLQGFQRCVLCYGGWDILLKHWLVDGEWRTHKQGETRMKSEWRKESYDKHLASRNRKTDRKKTERYMIKNRAFLNFERISMCWPPRRSGPLQYLHPFPLKNVTLELSLWSSRFILIPFQTHFFIKSRFFPRLLPNHLFKAHEIGSIHRSNALPRLLIKSINSYYVTVTIAVHIFYYSHPSRAREEETPVINTARFLHN